MDTCKASCRAVVVSAVLLSLCLACGLVFGQQSLAPDVIGDFGGGLPVKVAVQGNYAYCAATGVFTVYDITPRCNPTQVGMLNLPGGVYDVAVEGSYAYLAWDQGLVVVDISTPTTPVLVSSLAIPGFYRGGQIALAGGLAYLPWGAPNEGRTTGLAVVDVQDPSHPFLVANHNLAYIAVVAVSGNYLYISHDSNLFVYDVSDPTTLVLVGRTYTYQVGGCSLTIVGNYAYVGGEDLQVIDITDPTNPVPVGSTQLLGYWVPQIVVQGNLAYLAAGRIRTVDISDPAAPIVLNEEMPIDPASPYSWTISGLALTGNIVIAAGNSGLDSICIANPQTPGYLGHASSYGRTSDIALSARYAYVGQSAGLKVFDLAASGGPTLVGSSEGRFDGGVVIHNNYLYGAFNTHIHTFNIGDPTQPQWTHATPPASPSGTATTVSSGHLALSQGHLYEALGCSGLHVFDLTNPAEPAEVGANNSNVLCNSSVAARSSFAYVHMNGLLGGGARVDIYDVSNPAQPVLVAALPTGPNCCGRGLAISGDLLFVPGCCPGLQIYSLVDPTTPSPVGSYTSGAPVVEVSVTGQFAQLTIMGNDGENGLRILDVSDPTTPTLLGEYTGLGGGRDGILRNAASISASPYYVGFADRGWGITFFAVPECGNTQPGENVEVMVGQTTVIFSSVTGAGETLMSVSTASPGGEAPIGLEFLGDYYDISTTAQISGTMTVQIPYQDAEVPAGDEDALYLVRWDATTGLWVDVTTDIDKVNNVITGECSALSVFAIAHGPSRAFMSIGSNVVATVGDCTVNFELVTSSGALSSQTEIVLPSGDPAGYPVAGYGWDIETSAVTGGSITVTVHYDDTLIPAGVEGSLQLMHWEGSQWVDITTSRDPVNHTITGQCTSLGQFTIYLPYPALPQLPGKLAYTAVSCCASPNKILLYNSDPTVRNSLEGDWAVGPDWSPDGSKLLYQSTGLWVDPVDATPPTKVVEVSDCRCVCWGRWSPDGQRILYTVGAWTRGATIWIANADGTGAHSVLASDPTRINARAAWSPDALWIAYRCQSDAIPEIQLRLVHPDGSEDHPLLPTGVEGYPGHLVTSLTNAPVVWSPNAQHIALRFEASLPDGSSKISGIGTISVNGGLITSVWLNPPGIVCCASARVAAWSPDGASILFTSAHQLPPNPEWANGQAELGVELWQVAADGSSQPVRLTYDNSRVDHTGCSWWAPNTNPPAEPGEPVSVTKGDTTVTFESVETTGSTTVTVSNTPPAPEPSGFEFHGDYYDISTTSQISGTITVEIHYDDTGLTLEQEQALQLLHWENGQWNPVTVPPVDTVNNVITGECTSLSPFAVVVSTVKPDWRPPLLNGTSASSAAGPFKRGRTLPIKFQMLDQAGQLVADDVAQTMVATLEVFYEKPSAQGTPTDPGDSPPDIGGEFRYDIAEHQFIYNLSTKDAAWLADYTYGLDLLISGVKAGEVFFSLR